jgi:hypothetical protein
MTRTCERCGALFTSLNPLRKLCDECEKLRRYRATLVTLGIADGDLEANVWLDVLKQEGIPAIIVQNDALRGRFQTAPLPYSTEVLVRMQDLDRARELLDLDER